MSYYFAKRIDATFDDAVIAVTEKLKEEGFGVLADIDVRATFKKKLNIDFRQYRILGACHPDSAHRAIETEERIGLMLPCNVIVQETGDGAVEVAAIDPVASMQAVDNPALGELGVEIREKLKSVIDKL